jgi:hypothetical protein
MSNGILITEAGIDINDMAKAVVLYKSVQANKLTHEEVLVDYLKRVQDAASQLQGLQSDNEELLMLLGCMIYKNGIHDAIKDNLVVRPKDEGKGKKQLVWKDLKTYWNIIPSRKTMVVRYCVDIMRILADNRVGDSILQIHANKYDLGKLYEDIPQSFRFFGANLHPTIKPEESSKYLAFQRQVITLSGSKTIRK